MKHSVRLVTKGYWGVPSIDESTVALLPSTRGKSFGMFQLRDGKKEKNESDNANSAPAILAYETRFDASDNALNNGTSNLASEDLWSGVKTDFVELPSPFLSGQGISFTRSEYGASGTLSKANFILQNGGFCVRGYLFKPATPPDGAIPEGTDAPPVISLRAGWGNFVFQIRDGKPELVIVSEQAASIAAGEEYEPHSLSLGIGSDGWYNNPFTLTFIPEPMGRIHVVLEGSGTLATVEVKSQLEKKAPGIIWPAGALRVTCESGAVLWQVGYPRFANRGALYLSKNAPVADATIDLNGHAFLLQADNSSLGTSVIPALDSVQLKTLNRRYTPFWYGQWGTRLGGARTGIAAFADWDSDTKKDAPGNPPFLAASVSWDGDDESLILSNRFDLELRDVEGFLGIHELHYEALENRICDLYIDGVRVLANGIITSSTRSDVRSVVASIVANVGQGGVQAIGAACRIQITVADPWFILDEDLMMATPPGDGLHLGAYLRNVLFGAGFSLAEVTAIDATSGIVLPAATLGETPLVMPELGQSRGEYLRFLLERYGMGWRLYWSDAGTWVFAPRNTTVVATFTSAANANAPDGTGRYIMLAPIDRVHDFGEVYNWFAASGKEGDSGETPFVVWEQSEGIYARVGPNNAKFIGRRKRYPLINDDNIRTVGDAAIAVRSTAQKRATGGRGIEFTTYFHRNVFPDARVLADGVLYVVKRISDADIFADTMRLTLREVD
jgi:hypothetical protein